MSLGNHDAFFGLWVFRILETAWVFDSGFAISTSYFLCKIHIFSPWGVAVRERSALA